MGKVQAIIKHADDQCSQRGKRLTDKRKAVLSALLSSKKAQSAYDLVDYCSDKLGEKMPAMTVYRILEFLEEQQLVHKLELANRYVACTHITCDHKHEVSQFLICHECFRVEETTISTSMMRAFKNKINSAGFTLVSPQFEFRCLCAECAK